MGRAFSEIVSRDLAAVPAVYSIPPGRLHALDVAFGRRGGVVPGVSAERDDALAAGADQLGYGEYWLQNGRLHARLTLNDVARGKTRVISASESGVSAAADALARQVSAQASTYGTRNAAAVRAYALGLESADSQAAGPHFQESIAADPDFEPPYVALAQLKLQQRDQTGGAALLEQALAHRDRMPDIDRAQLTLEAAKLRGDSAAGRQALADLARLTPNDPGVWRSLGETAMAGHRYAQAVEADQRALILQPNDPVLMNQLGYALAYSGELEAALRALRQYAAVRPADTNPLDSMGDVNLLFGRLREAENFYLQAARKDPGLVGGAEFRKTAMARLMSGDLAGAALFVRQYVERRAQLRDPLVDYYAAEWLWISGSRKEAYQRLEQFARRVENSPLKEAAAEAYAELAVWSVALGDRSGAALLAQKAGQLTGPASGATVAVARFLAQPPASAAEWAARADRAFPQSAEKLLKQRALVYALLTDRQFSAAAGILQSLYDDGVPGANNDDIPVLLAWCYLETGRSKEAAGLLRFNPLPPSAGVQPFQVFFWPRLFDLRGRIAMLSGQADAARVQDRLFRQLSGQ
jgi:tetratricopeptide (TPR) repeat protein